MTNCDEPQAKIIGSFTHPVHGLYYIWHDGHAYNLSRTLIDEPICAYRTLEAIFRTKGL